MVRASSQNVGTGRNPKVAVGGKYLFVVNSAEEHTAGTGNVAIRLEVEVLSGTIAEQDGKTMKMQDFYPNAPTFFDLAAALSLTDNLTGQPFTPAMLKQMRDDLKAGKTVNTDYDFDPAQCVGGMFFANVVPEQDRETKKPKPDGWPRIGMEIYSVADIRAKSIPANEAIITEYLGMSRQELWAKQGLTGGGQSASPVPVAATNAPAHAPAPVAAAGAPSLD